MASVVFCKNCVFWSIDEDDQKMGECRKKAPVIIESMSDEEGALTGWPQSAVDDWCGDGSSAYIDGIGYIHGPYKPKKKEGK